VNELIFKLTDELEAIRFLTQSLEGQPAEFIEGTRRHLTSLDRRARLELRATLQKELKGIRSHYGAVAKAKQYCDLHAEAKGQQGHIYLPKFFIEAELFRRYERVFPRWPSIPAHAFVVFDGSTRRSLSQIYVAEAAFFDNGRHLIQLARGAHKGIRDFRKRTPEDQRALHTYLQVTATSLFQCLEAYLNGLAYGCFMAHHRELPIEDHDKLAEWNSKKKRRAFVPFEVKILEYPLIVARANGGALDVSGSEAVRFICGEGKLVRDALMHASPFVDPSTGRQEKFQRVMTVNLEFAERLFEAAKGYIELVERGVGKDPAESVPWLYR
jgi:hypothetical protein